MLSNLKFLEKNNFEIDNLYKINSYIKTDKNELLAISIEKTKNVGYFDELYRDFIFLGKQLYLEYKNEIERIDKNDTPVYGLIKYKNNYLNLEDYENDSRRIKVIENWLKECRYAYLKEINPDNNNKKIEIFYLTDIALFSYLVLSSLNNFYLEKDTKLKTKESNIRKNIETKYRKDLFNDIHFDTFTTMHKDDLNNFVALINFYMYNFEVGPGILILVENSRLIYNNSDVNLKYKYTKTYNYIYGLYWFILKMQLYSMLNGYTIVNMCSCGNVIIGKSKRCPVCKKLYDSYRHTIK